MLEAVIFLARALSALAIRVLGLLFLVSAFSHWMQGLYLGMVEMADISAGLLLISHRIYDFKDELKP